MTCPACDSTISKPAAEGGGVKVRSRWVRLTTEGKILIACPECGSELETLPKSPGRLVLHRLRPKRAPAADPSPSTTTSSPSSALPPPES